MVSLEGKSLKRTVYKKGFYFQELSVKRNAHFRKMYTFGVGRSVALYVALSMIY